MAFWLIFAIVVSLSIGFVMGATFRQYRPIKRRTHFFMSDSPGAQWGFMRGTVTGKHYVEMPPHRSIPD